MSQQFQIAGGSTIGRDHRLVPKNNHDSWEVWQTDDLTIGIVADGCGSGTHSEVGAKLGVRLLGSYLLRDCTSPATINWRRAERTIVSHIDTLAQAMGGDYRKIIENYFLFTMVGVVISAETAVFFAMGDGMVIVNDAPMSLGPFPGNMPPYIGYQLLAEQITIDPTSLVIAPILQIATNELESFLIATDGIDDFMKSETKRLPGLPTLVGSISQFWTNDRYFNGNPEIVSRQLKLTGRDWPHEQPEPGLLSDDTTIVAGRRIPKERTE